MSELNKMENEQYENDRTFELTKEVRTDILIKRNEVFNKKKRSGPRHSLKKIRIQIITFNIHETREIIVHKKLSRQLTS